MGVLNRIAICYTVGGLLFIFLRTRMLAAIAAALLLGYWALLAGVPFPDVRPTPGGDAVITKEAGFKNISQLNMASTHWIHGAYLQGVNLTDYLDQKYLPGRKYDGTYDPEGILSTLPAIVTGLLGIFAGLLIRDKSVPAGRKTLWLLGAGAGGAALGWLWGIEMPVIKKIWTSSYVLVAGGYSALLKVAHWMMRLRLTPSCSSEPCPVVPRTPAPCASSTSIMPRCGKIFRYSRSGATEPSCENMPSVKMSGRAFRPHWTRTRAASDTSR